MDLAERISNLSPRQREQFERKLQQQNIDISKVTQFITTNKEEQYNLMEPVEKKKYHPLSSAQQRFFMLQKMNSESTAYNISFVMWLEGNIQKPEFEELTRKIIHRHETLRTSFKIIEEEPVQQIHDEVEFEIEYYHAEVKAKVEEERSSRFKGTRGLAPLSIDPAARSLQPVTALISSFIHPFDLGKAPLFRVGLVQLQAAKHILMFDMHHIICDGASMNLVITDFALFYTGQAQKPLPIQYRDFCEWQHRLIKSGKLKNQEQYWLECLSGDLPRLNMPLDYPRPALQSFAGDHIHFHFDQALTREIKELMRETNTTLYMLLLALFNVLLSKYTLQEDIIVGSPISSRTADLENNIGLFIETIAIRNYPREEQPFAEFLAEVKENTLKAFENQTYPFGELLKHMGNEYDRSRNPLFDAMLLVQNMGGSLETREIRDIKLIPYENATLQGAKTDLSLEVINKSNQIFFHLEYCTALFKKETMERFIHVFKEITSAVIDNKQVKLKDINISYQLAAAESSLYDKAESEFAF